MSQQQSNVLRKLQDARRIIKEMKIKKEGKNQYSGYDYFTPEQINRMVWTAEDKTGLVHLFQLLKKESGYVGTLEISDIESGEFITLYQATDIPEIKATNAAQQIGGAVTYTLRYMLMTAFDIADNSLDFDSKDNRDQPTKQPAAAKTAPLPVISDNNFNKLIAGIKSEPQKAAGWITATRKKYRLNEAQEKTLADWEATL